LNVEFNQRAQSERDTHLRDLESSKVNIYEEIEKIKREHTKDLSHLQTELDEAKWSIEQKAFILRD
jgi:hypothetical protein